MKIKEKVLVILVLILSSISCEIGLGSAVDTEPPELTIEKPLVGNVIRDTFPISGSCNDDGEIESVKVIITNTENSSISYSYNAILDEGKRNWFCEINPKDQEKSLIDGKYEATVTVKDSFDHVVKATRTFTIDNTPPVIVLQRPSTKSTENSPDCYGQSFTLEGQAADDNNIDSLEVKIYQNPTDTTPIHSVTLNNVPPNIKLDVAKFVENEENDYSKIYGSSTKEGTKQFYCSIVAYDGAQRYPVNGNQESADKKGNQISHYYLYEEISSSVLSKYKITEVYQMMNGTFVETDDSRSATVSPAEVTNILKESKIETGTFSLNPANNPKFIVSGREALKKDGTDFTSSDNNCSNNSSVIIEVSTGLDAIPLVSDGLKVYILPCDNNGNVIPESQKIYPSNSTKTKSGTSYKFVTVITKNDGLLIGHNYILGVEGVDQNGNTVEPDGQGFGFHLAASGAAPELTLTTSVNGSTPNTDAILYVPGKNSNNQISKIVLSGSISSDEIISLSKLYIDDDTTGIDVNLIADNTGMGYSFTKEISVTDFPNSNVSGQHILKYVVSNGIQNTVSKTVRYDVDGPIIELISVNPTAVDYGTSESETDGFTYLNTAVPNSQALVSTDPGVKFKISITDDFETVDSSTEGKKPVLKIFKASDLENPIISQIITSPAMQEVTINTREITSTSQDVVLKVFAYDKAGNYSELKKIDGSYYTYKVNQDTDKPIILPNNADDTTLKYTTKESFIEYLDSNPAIAKNNLSVGQALSFKLIDEDGIAKISVKKAKHESETPDAYGDPEIQNFTSSNPKEYTYLYKVSDNQVGYFKICLDVEDIYGNTNTKEFYARVTAEKPTVNGTISNRYISTNSNATKKSTTANLNIISSENPFIVSREVKSATGTIIEASTVLESSLNTTTYSDPYTPAAALTNGEYNITYTVKDKNQKQDTVTLNFLVDNSIPTIEIPSTGVPTAQQTEASSFKFNGTATDAGGSELEKIELTFKNPSSPEFNAANDIIIANGTTSWNSTITFSEYSGIFGTEGQKTFYARSVDGVGNASDWMLKEFTYDKDPPVLSAIKLEISETGKTPEEYILTKNQTKYFKYIPVEGNTVSYKIKGTLTESNILNEFKINDETQTITPEGNWEKVIDVTDNTEITFTIVAKDAANREVSEIYKIYKDNNVPVVEITNPINPDDANAAVSGANSLAGSTYTFRGSSTDAGSGIQIFKYLFTDNAFANSSAIISSATAANAGENGWVTATGESFSLQKDLATGTTGADNTKIYEGKHYIYLYAQDKCGNESSASREYWVDKENPKIEENIIGTTGKKVKATETSITLSGTVSDNNGINSVKITDDLNTASSWTADIITTLGSWSVTINIGNETNKLKDGVHTLSITATDNAERTTTIQRTITVDTNVPANNATLSIKTIADNTIDSANTWLNSSSVAIELTEIEDAKKDDYASGISTVEYSVDGNNWISLSQDSTTLTKWTGTVNCSKQGLNTIETKIKDVVGNETIKTTTVNVDTKEPTVPTAWKVDGVDNFDSSKLINGRNNVTVLITVADDVSAKTGTQTDPEISTGIGKITYKGNSDYSITSAVDSGTNAGKWELNIPKDALKAGTANFEIYDKAGNVYKWAPFSIQIDKTAPTVKMNLPADADKSTTATGTQVNKTIKLDGTSKDTGGAEVASIDLCYYDSTNSKWEFIERLSGSELINWESSEIDTRTAFGSIADDTSITIVAIVSDTAGNRNFDTEDSTSGVITDNTVVVYDTDGTTEKGRIPSTAYTDSNVGNDKKITIIVNQDTDRPVVKLTNLTKQGADFILKYGTNATLEGSITDDDATATNVVKKLIISENPITSENGTTSGTTTPDYATGSFTFTPSTSEDGSKTFYIYVKDNNDEEFYTTYSTAETPDSDKLKRPYYQYKNEEKTDNNAGITYKSDSNAPALGDVKIQPYTKASSAYTAYGSLMDTGSNCRVGGTNKNAIEFVVNSSDANGIVGYEMEIKQGSNDSVYYRSSTSIGDDSITYQDDAGSLNDTKEEWKTPKIDLISTTGEATGTAVIKVYDGCGLYANQTYTFTIDNKAPQMTNISPTTGSVVYGTQTNTVSGTIADTDTSNVYYAVTKSADAPTEAVTDENVWKKYETASYITVSLQFDGSTADNHLPTLHTMIGTVYGMTEGQVSADDNNKDIYVHFKLFDSCGNESNFNTKLNVIPNGDKPSLTLTYPELNSEGEAKSTAGTVRAYGSATVQVASVTIEGVYIQIDPTFDGTFNENWETELAGIANANYSVVDIGTSGKRGIKTSGTQNWNLPINPNKEFDLPTNPRNMAIRVYALSSTGKVSDPVIRPFKIDPNAPKIGSDSVDTTDLNKQIPLQIVQFDNPANVGDMNHAINKRSYTQDMWVNGDAYLVATIYDNAGIKEIKLDKGTGIPEYYVKDNVLQNSTIAKANTSIISGKNNYNVFIPLPTNTGVGKLNYQLSATKNSEDNLDTKEAITINFDNVAPKIATNGHEKYSINPKVQQSDGFYKLQSYFDDSYTGATPSGLMGIAFYFVRRGNGTSSFDRIYDPMLVQSDTNNKQNLSGLIYKKGLWWKKLELTRDENNLSKITIPAADSNIRVGGYVMLGDTIYRIKSKDSSTVFYIDGLAPIDINSTTQKQDVYFAMAMVVDNTIAESASGTKAADGYYDTITNDDGDRMVEVITGTSIQAKWEALINSSNIPDGPIEIHYVVYDNAQNYSIGIVGNKPKETYEAYTTADAIDAKTLPSTASANLADRYTYDYLENNVAYVSNNAPRIAGVTVSTKYDGTNTVKVSKFVDAVERIISGNKKQRASNVTDLLIASENGNSNGNALMAIKDAMDVEIEVVGGNGKLNLQYSIDSAYTNGTNYRNGTIDDWADGAKDFDNYIKTDESNDNYVDSRALTKITYSKTDFDAVTGTTPLAQIPNSSKTLPTWFTYNIWDSTEETTKYVDSQNATVKLALNIQVHDSTAPKTVISPLFWNSSSENSVYYNDTNSKLEGHIELHSELGNLGTTYGTDDDKVSGKVVFRGFAYDNVKLSELKWALVSHADNNTYTSPTYLFPATDGAIQNGATFNGSTWTNSGSLTTNYYKFEVSTSADDGAYFDEKGHKVAWTLTLDTAYIKDAVAKDARVYIYAKDAAGEETTLTNATNTSSSSDQETYDNETTIPTYKVDVVPYITKVTTRLSNMQKSNPSVYNRTSIGKYPVKAGEKIYIEGYNLTAGDTVNIGSVSLAALASDAGGLYTTVSATGVSSGDLVITSKNKTDVTTINNMNNNDAKGTYSKSTTNAAGDYTIYSNYYNRQPNNINNNTLTDDVSIDVWDIKTAVTPVSGTIKYPNMKINPQTGMPGFSFANAVIYFNMPGTVQGDNKVYSQVLMESCNGGFTNNNFCWDSNGNAFGAALGTDTGYVVSGASFQIFAVQSPNNFTTDRNTQRSYANQKNASRLESINVSLSGSNKEANKDSSKFITDTDRITSPALATSAGSTAGNTKLHVAYYDRQTKQIRYRSGEIKISTTNNNTTCSIGNANTYSLADYGYSDFKFDSTNGILSACPDSIDVDGSSFVYEENTDGIGTEHQRTGTGNKRIEIVANNALPSGRKAYTTSVGSYGAGEYVDIGIINSETTTPIVVLAWHDSVNGQLMLSWEDPSKTTYNQLQADTVAYTGAWQTNATVVENDAGQHVQLRVDPNNGVHLAYYASGDLHYAFYRWTGTGLAKVTNTPIVVDGYQTVGAKCTLGVSRVQHAGSTTAYDYIPYIGYQMNVNTAKVAYPVKFTVCSEDSNIYYAAGDGSINDMFTDNWACEIVPTSNTPIDYKVCADVYTKNGVQSEIPTGTGSTKSMNHVAGYNVCDSSQVYGNGTANPVVAYAVSEQGALEMAQKK